MKALKWLAVVFVVAYGLLTAVPVSSTYLEIRHQASKLAELSVRGGRDHRKVATFIEAVEAEAGVVLTPSQIDVRRAGEQIVVAVDAELPVVFPLINHHQPIELTIEGTSKKGRRNQDR